MDYSKLIDIGSKVSLAVVLMVILYGGMTGVWVYGTTYKDMVADRDQWKQLALQGFNVAKQATVRATPITGGPPREVVSLPTNPSKQEVNAALNSLHEVNAYKTEPSVPPLP